MKGKSISLPASVAPGQTIDLTLELVAPEIPGSYTGGWMLRSPSSQVFGVGANGTDYLYVTINVTITPTPGSSATKPANTSAPTTAPTAASAPTSTATATQPAPSATASPTVSPSPSATATGSPLIGQVMDYQRTENSACDEIKIIFTTTIAAKAEGYACGSAQKIGETPLTTAQFYQMLAWINGLKMFHYEGPETNSSATFVIDFSGVGSNDPTSIDLQAMNSLCNALLAAIK